MHWVTQLARAFLTPASKARKSAAVAPSTSDDSAYSEPLPSPQHSRSSETGATPTGHDMPDPCRAEPPKLCSDGSSDCAGRFVPFDNMALLDRELFMRDENPSATPEPYDDNGIPDFPSINDSRGGSACSQGNSPIQPRRTHILHWCDSETGNPTQAQRDALKGGDKYELLKQIGEGGFGDVFLAQCRLTGRKVAIKFIDVDTPRVLELVTREVLNLRSCAGHPHVVGFLELFLTRGGVGIVMEYLNGGTVQDLLERHGALSERSARLLFQQLVAAVEFMRRKGISNRDIKLDNLLLHSTPHGQPQLKVCDFGLSKNSELGSAPRSLVGTPSYIAPEVLMQHDEYDGHKADVFACGVVLYFMLHGRHPFEHSWNSEGGAGAHVKALVGYFQAVLGRQYPVADDLSPECRLLMQAMLDYDPAARPTMADVMLHPWTTCGGAAAELVGTQRRSNEFLEKSPAPKGMQSCVAIQELCRGTFVRCHPTRRFGMKQGCK